MSKLAHSGTADMDAIERQGRALEEQEGCQQQRVTHSPVPWKNGRDVNGDVVICQADTASSAEWNEEYQANRRLFDAASDLLEALKAAEDALARCYDVTEWPANGGSSQDRALAVVRQALAKAEAS